MIHINNNITNNIKLAAHIGIDRDRIRKTHINIIYTIDITGVYTCNCKHNTNGNNSNELNRTIERTRNHNRNITRNVMVITIFAYRCILRLVVIVRRPIRL